MIWAHRSFGFDKCTMFAQYLYMSLSYKRQAIKWDVEKFTMNSFLLSILIDNIYIKLTLSTSIGRMICRSTQTYILFITINLIILSIIKRCTKFWRITERNNHAEEFLKTCTSSTFKPLFFSKICIKILTLNIGKKRYCCIASV